MLKKIRMVYYGFVFSVVLLICGFTAEPSQFRARGGGHVYTFNERVVFHAFTITMLIVTAWYSVIQMRRDWMNYKIRKYRKRR
jgi:hypothetical protein